MLSRRAFNVNGQLYIHETRLDDASGTEQVKWKLGKGRLGQLGHRGRIAGSAV